MSSVLTPAAIDPKDVTTASVEAVQARQPERIARLGRKKLDFVCSSAAPQRVKNLTFGALTADEVTRASHIEVLSSDIYNDSDRSAVRGGALDPRLGCISNDSSCLCETCGMKLSECVGHCAFIRLALPVFHPGFFGVVTKILQSICKGCSRVMVDEGFRQYTLAKHRNPWVSAKSHVRDAKFKAVWNKAKKAKSSVCRFCGYTNGVVKKAGALRIMHYPNGNKPPSKKRDDDDEPDAFADEDALDFDPMFFSAATANEDLRKHMLKAADELHPLRVLKLFENMPSEDVQLLDMDPVNGRPEGLLLTRLPVPPLCVRPTVCADPTQGSTEDDLTMKACEIVSINQMINALMDKGSPISMVLEQWDNLQYEVARYINSDTPNLPNNANDKPLRGVAQRLKGKQGRFRGNLSGKRVDFSGRTVISPDPNLGIHQVGVPKFVAMTLTFPEKVTSFNIDRLRSMVRNGPDSYPGANFYKSSDGDNRFLKYADKEKIANSIEVGGEVERQLIDGDVVLFNRQPSLHRISIMAHRVRVGNHRTFRFNECVCAPYNADFDGDEMNLHVPQTQEARAEALELMGVVQNLVTPRNGQPIVAAIQDFITTSFLVTSKDVFMDRAEFFQVISMMTHAVEDVRLPPPCIIKPIEMWTGKQVFSTLLRNAALHGELHTREERKGSKFFVPLMTQTSEKGFEGVPNSVGKLGFKKFMIMQDTWVIVRNGELLTGQLGKRTLGDGAKNSIFYILQREYGVEAVAHAMNRLARLGARWLGDAGFSIGVDDVRPSAKLEESRLKRFRAGYEECDKFLNKHKEGTLDVVPGHTRESALEDNLNNILSKIRSSLGSDCLANIDPATNAALTMAFAGSKGSAVNISQMVTCIGQQTVNGSRAPDGFFGRSLPHFQLGPETSRKPAAKGFVRNSFFSGMTPTEFFFHTMAGREGLVDTAVKTAETGYMQRRLMKALEDLAVQYDSTVRTSAGNVVQMRYGDDGLDPSLMERDDSAIDFKRLLETVLASKPTCHGRMTVAELVEYVEAAIDAQKKKFSSDGMRAGLCYILERAKEFLSQNLRKGRFFDDVESLSLLHAGHVDEFIVTIVRKLYRAEVEPGTAVGAIGAQSIGEPGTQMTLKTFHHAGVSSMNITQGVPRLKEIINASKKIATPVLTAQLVNPKDIEAAAIVKARLENTYLGQVVHHVKEVIRDSGQYVSVRIDFEHVTKLGLDFDLEQVANRIASHKFALLKVYPDDIVMIKPDLLRVTPSPKGESHKGGGHAKSTREARRKVAASIPYYLLMSLRNQLCDVSVQGVQGVGRAVVTQKNNKGDKKDNEDEEDGIWNFAEGYEAEMKEKAMNKIKEKEARRKEKENRKLERKLEKERKEKERRKKLGLSVENGVSEKEKQETSGHEANGAKDDMKGKSEYYMQIESDDLRNVMAVPGLIGTKTFSNHIIVSESTLGIEAAHGTIIQQISSVMSAHGMTIDQRHVQLLADCMTSTGEVLGITRFGIQKMKTSTLMLASFETAVDHLFHAAVHSTTDEVTGVSERIIMGLPVPLGTGLFEMNREAAENDRAERFKLKKGLLSDEMPKEVEAYISDKLKFQGT